MGQPTLYDWVPSVLVTDTIMEEAITTPLAYLLGRSGDVLITDDLEIAVNESAADLTVRNINEVLSNTANLHFATGAAEGALSGSNTIADLQAIITQATPSTLKGALAFRTNRGDSIAEAARLNDSGNMGIGTGTGIDQRLHVQATGACAVQVENDSGVTGGDPALLFAINGSVVYGLGVDDSDADGFKISRGGALGTNDNLVLKSSLVELKSEAHMDFHIDSDNNDSSNQFRWLHNGNTELMRLADTGKLSLGTALDNTNFTDAGLTIKHASSSGGIALKEGGVAHGMTSTQETDTYLALAEHTFGTGGGAIAGWTEGTIALALSGYQTTANTTKGTSATGAIYMTAALKSGTSIGAVGANGNLMVLTNVGSTKFIFDAEGDSHEDGTGWTAYDDFDDLALLNALDHSLDRRLRQEASAWLAENEAALEAARIVSFNRDTDGVPFINRSRLGMLLVGAVRQLGQQLGSHTLALQSAGLLAS